MHAFIDKGNYSDMTIDKALRLLLKDFKLPGECHGQFKHMQSMSADNSSDNAAADCFSRGLMLLSCMKCGM